VVSTDSYQISRVRYYSGYSSAVLSFVYTTITFFGMTFLNISTRLAVLNRVLQPQQVYLLVWPSPISLATTFGILSFPHLT
jgi:hypothetical protein